MNDILQKSIAAYISAWNTPDLKDTKQALAHAVVPDIIYSDPFTNSTTGIDALVTVMVRLGQNFPGITHELSGDLICHHNFGYYHWIARLGNGREIPGVDYIDFSSDGRIARVVTFTDEADWQINA